MRLRTSVMCLLVLPFAVGFQGRPADPMPSCKPADSWPDLDVSVQAGTVSRRDAAGKRLWKTRLDREIEDTGWVSIVRDKRRIYLANKNGVTALDNGSGKVLWYSKGPNISLLLSGELLLATGWDDPDRPGRWLLARSVKDGSTVLKTRLPHDERQPLPVTAVADLFAVVSGWDETYPWRSVLFDRRGRIRFDFDRLVVAGIRQGDDYVFLSQNDIARVSADRKARWKRALARDFGDGGGLIAMPSGDVLAYRFGLSCDSGVEVIRFQPANGTQVWKTRCSGIGIPHSAYRHHATAVIERDQVVVRSCGTNGTFTERLDLKTGRQLRRVVHLAE